MIKNYIIIFYDKEDNRIKFLLKNDKWESVNIDDPNLKTWTTKEGVMKKHQEICSKCSYFITQTEIVEI